MKNTSFDFMFNAACYVNGDDPVAAQKVVRPFSSEFVKKGKRATLEAALECGGVVHQCDFFSGNGVPTTNPDLGGRLLQAKRVVSGPCEPCVGCTPTPCVKPPEPDCEHGPATYNPGDCTWESGALLLELPPAGVQELQGLLGEPLLLCGPAPGRNLPHRV
jgi:hypothetical protein